VARGDRPAKNAPGVYAYDTAKGERYKATWRDLYGRPKEKGGFATVTAAKKHKQRMDGARVEQRDTTVAKTTFAEWWQVVWETKARLAPKTLEQYESVMRLHVLPAIGHMRLVDIRPIDIERMLTKMRAADAGTSLVGRAKALTSEAMARAVSNRIPGMGPNPCADVKGDKKQRKTPKALRVPQVEALKVVETVGKRPRRILTDGDAVTIDTLAYAGLRPEELAGLLAKHFDPLTDKVTISETVTEVRGKLDRRKVTKTYMERTISLRGLPPGSLDELRRRARTSTPNAPLFRGRRGGEWRLSSFRRRLERAVAAFNLQAAAQQRLPEDFTPYGLRHTCATILAGQGVPVSIAAKFMGHDPVQFLKTYAEVFDSQLDDAAIAIGKARVEVIDVESRQKRPELHG
jgi:integrase